MSIKNNAGREKTVNVQLEEETKTVSLQEFLNKSFECLFNQNVHLHRALAQVLQDEFKKQEERKLELEEKIDALEKNIKEGFLHYTREIIKGLDDTTQALLDTIFFGKKQFNLAKGLKATQVHDSDTPSLSHRDRWESGQ